MKNILLSATAAAIAVSSLGAKTITLYQDKNSGAIYTKPGPDRIKLGTFVSAEESDTGYADTKKMAKGIKATVVKSKVKTLKISGKHYLGFTHINYADSKKDDISRFETRRNYLQVKAYWNSTDYARITLDTFQQYNDTGSKDDGSWLVRLKYAYIYLDEILPYTGIEFGQVHRPWIDWEEHHGWWYRSIAKTFVEEKKGAHLTNSADLGFNLKTKTDYFSSEIGLFNGEGYHDTTTEVNTDLSFEWRLTANLLGTGKKKVSMSDEYADISFLGQLNQNYQNYKTMNWYGIHGVYNNPMFLLAGIYVKSDNDGGEYEGKGWSVNGEFRPIKKWSILGRYDNWDVEKTGKYYTRTQWIAGAAYKYNKNVKFIGNLFYIDPSDKVSDDEETRYMFTAEVKW